MKKLLSALVILLAVSSSAAAQTDYLIGSQDILAITVFGETEFSGHFSVDQDGTFTYPQLGRVKAGGMTLRALEQELKRQLADGYLKNPQVAVAIETYRSQRILVIGEVRSPGEYQLTGEMTLLAALVRAGSTTPTAGHEALVVRPKKNAATGEDPSDVFHVNLVELQGGNIALNMPLQDGDTVNVPKALSVFVTGQVKNPGAYSVDLNTTVLQVMSLAGGLTDRGSDRRITIQRTVDGKKAELKAKPNDIVKPGDTITIGERFF